MGDLAAQASSDAVEAVAFKARRQGHQGRRKGQRDNKAQNTFRGLPNFKNAILKVIASIVYCLHFLKWFISNWLSNYVDKQCKQ